MVAMLRMLAVYSKCLLASVAFVLTGCAFNYVDGDGNESYLGFMAFKSVKNSCATSTTVKTVGVNYDSTTESGGLNVGYKSVTKLYIDHDIDLVFEIDANNYVEVKEYNKAAQADHFPFRCAPE